MRVVVLTLLMLFLSGTLSEDGGEDNRCQTDMCNILKSLKAIEARLNATENQMEEMRNIQDAVAVLQRTDEVQGKKLQVFSLRANATEFNMKQQQHLLDELKNKIEDKPKIAFLAALAGYGHITSSDRETNLAFRNVLMNIGNAYNSASGVFSAPVRGVYYFSFSSFGFSGRNVCVSLFKNSERMLSACDHHSEPDTSDSAGNGGTLHLEQGAHVYMTLHVGSHIFASAENRSTFRGFLLFRT
ncbi:complement C1q and tumor necrosis factor-related protein 9A-like [Esox lucius]|uniref:C1q domain-containing protein n=1 Tax=Esox lucius TaxID=8010 RepID=A0A3P8XSB2_ESOLU|nr:complement C1q and tumor necrosis factor-related protein 9A-like [Esox lucius]